MEVCFKLQLYERELTSTPFFQLVMDNQRF